MNQTDFYTFLSLFKDKFNSHLNIISYAYVLKERYSSNSKITNWCNNIIDVNLNYLNEIDKFFNKMTEMNQYLMSLIEEEITKNE